MRTFPASRSRTCRTSVGCDTSPPSTAGTCCSTRADKPATLLATTEGDPARSRLWRECLSGLGVTDVASLVCADRFGCWAWLDLWRTGGPAFAPADAAFLAELAPLLALGLREAQARTFVDDAEALDLSGPAVVVLRPDLTVRTQTGVGRPRRCSG